MPNAASGFQVSNESVGEFIDRLSKALSPQIQECFVDETKLVRNAVLAVGLVLILLTYGAIDFSTEASFVGIKFAPKTKGTLLYASGTVQVFLVVVLAARCYVDWAAWKIKNLSPQWSLAILSMELTATDASRLTEIARLNNEIQKGAQALPVRRLNEMMVSLTEMTSGQIAKQQQELSSLLTEYLPSIQVARKARFWLEAFFPLVFGAFAAALALVQ